MLWGMVPPDNPLLYKICKRYVDQYNGDNDSDFRSNGELRFMRSVLPDCTVVFDVGANIGDWAAMAASINPSATLHCFEPSKPTFQRLQERVPANVTCNNLGLSSTGGEATLYVFSEEAGSNSLHQRKGLGGAAQEKEEKVILDTIDGYCQRFGVRNIDLLKVDVEGHELEVFKGGKELLRRGQIKRIQFEYGGCNIDSRTLLKDFFEFFEPYGYVFHKLRPKMLQRIARYDQRLETYQYQNWVLLSKDNVSQFD